MRPIHRPSRDRAWDALALLVLGFIAWRYFWRLDAYLVNDDEGSYLYAAWRIALGELPYRDFLTPQLPGFLIPGGLLMQALGPEVWAARALAVGATLGAGAFTWALARRLYGPAVGLAAGALLLLHPEVFLHGRTFRADPFMLCYAAAGAYAFSRAAFPRPGRVDPPDRRWLALSGVAFGLATLAKLFGPFALAGCLAWLVVDSLARGRHWRVLLGDLLWVLVPAGLTVGLGLGSFALLAGPAEVFEAVIGHHLLQNADKVGGEVRGDALALYFEFLRQHGNALLAFGAIAVALAAIPARDRRSLFLAWQLPTAIFFLLLSREKYPRHLVYLIPAMSTLLAAGAWQLAAMMARATTGRAAAAPEDSVAALGARSTTGAGSESRATPLLARLRSLRSSLTLPATMSLALVLALLFPWWLLDRDNASRRENGTERLADFSMLLTPQDEMIFSDYSELNFYARRPTTYAGASLSAGAAGSGQISWARLEKELAGGLPRLLLLDHDPEYAHLQFLTDREAFLGWVDEHYGPPAGVFRRAGQRYAVHVPKERPLPVMARFEGGPTLLAAAADRVEVLPGERVEIKTAWHADREVVGDLGITLRLLDEAGLEQMQGDGPLEASDGAARLGVRPAGRWEPGEMTAERTGITVPLGLPPGEYDLLLGLYTREDGAGGAARGLDAFNAEGSPLGQSVWVGKLRVLPWEARAEDVPDAALDLDLRDDPPRAGPWTLLGRGVLPESVEAGRLMQLDLWWMLDGIPRGRDRVRLTLGDEATGVVVADWEAELLGGHAGVPDGMGAGDGRSGEDRSAADADSEMASVGGEAGGAVSKPRVLRQRLAVPIEADASDGRYALSALLPHAGNLGAADGHEAVDLGSIKVSRRDLSDHRFTAPRPAPEIEMQARFGAVAELVGATLERGDGEGETETVELLWRAIAPAPINYKVTVQVLDEAGQVVAQHDAEPAEGRRPTTGWIRGEYVVDRHPLGDWAPDEAGRTREGRFRYLVGVYHPLTGKRLTVEPEAARAEGVPEMVPLPGHRQTR